MVALETNRLVIRRFDESDAGFILDLLNQPSFIQFIGDRNVRTPADARQYILKGPVAMYDRHSLGLCAVVRKQDGTTIGMAGLIKRDTLPDVDLGFAFLPAYWAQGYAREASAALLRHGHVALGLPRIVAITNPDNAVSRRLLRDLGFAPEGTVRLTNDGMELDLLVSTAAAAPEAVEQQPGDQACGRMTDADAAGARMSAPGHAAPTMADRAAAEPHRLVPTLSTTHRVL